MTMTPAHALLLTTALTLAAPAAEAADVFTLSSTTFKDGALLPPKVGDIPARGPNCKGDNVSPELSWSNVPEGTRSFALIVIDPDAGFGAGISHWVAYGITPETTSFAEGEVSQPGDKFSAGKSTKGIPGFGCPCPPPGSPHHYMFQIVATDLDPKAPELKPGMTREELAAALKDHVKGSAGLVTRFKHP